MDDEGITIFELRSYRVLDGRRDAFADHVRNIRLPIYSKVGWRCDGFWSSTEEPTRVSYTLRWKSLEERAEMRAVLAADSEWIAYKNSDPEVLVDDFATTLMTKFG